MFRIIVPHFLLLFGIAYFEFFYSYYAGVPDVYITTGPSTYIGSCVSEADYIEVRNQEKFALNTANWSVYDENGTYRFPYRWIEPGEIIHVWHGHGVDDKKNLYAGRPDRKWNRLALGYAVSFYGIDPLIITDWSNSCRFMKYPMY